MDSSTFDRFLQDQGKTNGCGTTSLAMLMSFWKDQPGAYTRGMIDASIRRFNLPTAPTSILDYLRSQGFRAEAVNNASNEMRRYLDMGVPVQVLYDDATPKDLSVHYVAVVGYRTDAQGEIVSFKIADPEGGIFRDMPAGDLKRRWANLKVANLSTGLNELMIVTLPGQNVPVRGRDGIVRSSNDIALPSEGGNWSCQVKLAAAFFGAVNFLGKAADVLGGFFTKRS